MKTSITRLPKTLGRFTGTAAFCLLLVAGAAGVHAERSSLVQNSPFVWEGFVPPEERQAQRPREQPEPEPPEDDPLDSLEVRGITVMGGQTYVSLHDPENDESFWLAAGESEGGYTVTEYEGSDTVRVRRGDSERSITLKETQVATLSEDEQRRQEREARGRRDDNESAEETDERLRQAAQELRRRRAIQNNRGDDDN